MSINRFRDEIYMDCDGAGCSVSLSQYTDEGNDGFNDLLREAKEQGWKSVRENGEWAHYCPDCQDA